MSSPPDAAAKQDAFISYAHANNKPLFENSKGWVDDFHKHLELQLVEVIGRDVTIWRDPQLAGNSVLLPALKNKLKQTTALIAILSPGYLNSEWCMRELREFCALARENGGLHFKDRSRIFAVVKLPPHGGKYPDELTDQLRYEFFTINDQTKRPEEFRPDPGGKNYRRYWDKLSDLAWALNDLLLEMGAFDEPVAPDTDISSESSSDNNNLAETTETGPLDKPAAPDTNISAEASPDNKELEETTEMAALPELVELDRNIFSEDSAGKKKAIYLAETTEDLADQRRQIKEELRLHGYKVLPERPLPYVFGDYATQVRNNLSEAGASINLLGRSYGLIPDGAGDISIIRLQLDLANEFAKKRSGFKRLIWMPEKWETSDLKLGLLLDQLKALTDPHKGVEFLQTSLEEFKTLMHERLAVSVNGHSAEATATLSSVDQRKVYFICDRRDVVDAKPLISYLQTERRYDVVLPEFEEAEGETPLAELHQQKLLECDGALVYWGYGSSRWANSKRSDLEKHAGLEKTEASARIRPLRAKAFYVTQPSDDLKDVFNPPTARVIKNFGVFDPALLKDFILDLEGGNNDKGGHDDVR